MLLGKTKISGLTNKLLLTIEPGGNDGGDEELRALGVGTSIGHGQVTGALVLDFKVLVVKLAAIDGLTTNARAVGKVTTLKSKRIHQYIGTCYNIE